MAAGDGPLRAKSSNTIINPNINELCCNGRYVKREKRQLKASSFLKRPAFFSLDLPWELATTKKIYNNDIKK